MLLLEGAETYGLGSWADIADHIGGYRHKDEVRDHYISTYINSAKFPLPEHGSPKDRRLLEENPREAFQTRKKRRIEDRKEELKNAPQAPPKQKPVSSAPSCHEVQGYMPGRLEFEHEHLNEAEEAVQHMQFEPGEGIDPETGEIEPEMVLKMSVMDIYNHRLTTRVERKRFLFEHQLLEYRRNTALEKKKSNDERELAKRFKPHSRLMKKNDYDHFGAGMEYELNLRQAIAQLQEWRNLEVADLKDGEEYEARKAKRLAQITQPGSYTALPRPPKNQPVENSSTVTNLTSLDLTLKLPGDPPGPPGALVGLNGTIGNDKDQATKGPVSIMTNGITSKNDSETKPSVNGCQGNGTTPVPETRIQNNANGTPLSHRPKFVLQPQPNATPFRFTNNESFDQSSGVIKADDLHLLSYDEQDLCSQLRLMPRSYIAIKEAILREAVRQGGSMKKKAAKEVARIDTVKGGKLFDFFVHSGWVGKA